MTPTPITIPATESLNGARELMAMKRIRHLPVVDAHGKLVALVTDRDLRRAAPSPLFPGQQADEAKMDQVTVERIMVRAPCTIGPHQPLEDAIGLLVEKKYGALPVVENGKLVGILTPIDVMRALSKKKP
jgi:CBS domain-containing protein